MVDRAPTKPNRYAVYDENHNFIRYEYHERADEPTQVGDALNKANLLPDAVATALGLTGNPQVKDALNKLKTFVDTAQTTANGRAQIATGSYTGTGTYGSANKNTLTLDAPVRLVVIFGYWTRGSNPQPVLCFFTGKGLERSNTTGVVYMKNSQQITIDDFAWENDYKTLKWYAASADSQLNMSDYKYQYAVLM